MRINIFVLIAGLFGVVASHAQAKVIETKTVKSKTLNRTVNYSVYLPPNYEQSERTYPVVYLLHGYTDNQTGWVQFGEVDRYADKAISEGTIPPMIIIMPDAGVSWYINSYDGKEKYEDFFIKEFMPEVEKSFHIKQQRAYRGIAGLSMGGYGSLIYAIKHADLFESAAPLSASVYDDSTLSNTSIERWDKIFGQLFGRDLKGKDRLTKTWYQNSVLKLVSEKSVEELSKVRYWIDCGDDDHLTKGNSLLHIALTDKKVPHEYRVRDGAHNWTYWRTGIIDALEFIGQGFRK